MKHFALDMRAEALLIAVIEKANGDLRAAFSFLCSRASLADINGESFEDAVARAVADLFSRPALINAALHAPRESQPEAQS